MYETEVIETLFNWVVDKAHELYPTYKVGLFNERVFSDATSEDYDLIFVVHLKSSSTDTKMSIIETSLSVLSEKDDFDKAYEILSEVVKEHNLKTISKLGGYSVFNTPYLTNKFVEQGDSYRAEITVDGSFVVSPSVQNTTLKVDGEDVFLLMSAINLVGNPDPVVLGSSCIAKSRITSYTRTFTIKVYCDTSSAFINKCFDLWGENNSVNPNTVFNMVITYGENKTYSKKMLLKELSQSSVIGSVSVLELSFIESDEV